MALTPNDLLHGVDFAALSSATGPDHNNLVDLAEPLGDSATEGKGIVLWTVDLSLGVPTVPDATALFQTKWIRYIWVRRPNATDPVKTSKLYVWNSSAPNDVTYLKWIEIGFDTTALEAQIAAAQLAADNAQATADNANIVAANAQSQASTALNTANNALSVANNALNVANTPPAVGSITATMLETNLDLSGKTITLPPGSVTAANLVNPLDLTGKTVILPASIKASKFQSVDFTVSAAGAASVAHGLLGVPIVVRAVVVCQTINNGYAVGDELDADKVQQVLGQDLPTFSFGATATEVFYTIASGMSIAATYFQHKTTGVDTAFDPANWKLRLYAVYIP